MKSAKKKRGRPPKPHGARRSKNRTFRIRENLDDYLIGKAHETGRSVSEEIEARIARSFEMDALLEFYVGAAAPLLNAVTTAVSFSLMANLPGADRYRLMQAATGYVIAAFGSEDTATTHTREKVSDVRWPPLSGKPDEHELQGLITALWVLSNLNPERLADQIADLNEIVEADPRRPRPLSDELYQMAEEAFAQGRTEEANRLRRMAADIAATQFTPSRIGREPTRRQSKGS